jgi:hypothetical protein
LVNWFWRIWGALVREPKQEEEEKSESDDEDDADVQQAMIMEEAILKVL